MIQMMKDVTKKNDWDDTDVRILLIIIDSDIIIDSQWAASFESSDYRTLGLSTCQHSHHHVRLPTSLSPGPCTYIVQ